MALMKMLRGGEESLKNQELHDGYIWFTKDRKCMYIDHYDSTNTLVRSKISAEYAEKLRYIQDGETIEIDPIEIPTKQYVEDRINSIFTGPSYDATTGNLTIGTVSTVFFDGATGNLTIQ
jgi:hypothetical protein